MKKWLALFLATIMVFSTIGFVVAEETTTFGLTPLPERTTLRVGFFSGSGHSIPFYIADQEGFFDELNIDIEYVSFINGPAMMEASASWDICDVGGPGALVGMFGYDVNMIGICDYEENTAMFVRDDSPLLASQGVAISDRVYGVQEAVKGATVLYPSGTTLQMVVAAYADQFGLALEDLESVNMDVSSALTAFKGGSGDILAVWNAIAVSAEEAGYVRIADAGMLDVVPACGLCATQDALANKKDLLAYAWSLYYLTWQWCNESDENMEKAIQYYVDSCEEEGVTGGENVCRVALEYFRCPTVAGAIALMTETEPDEQGLYTTRELLKAENDLLGVMDFFISLDKYESAQRTLMLDQKMVNGGIAQYAAQMLLEQGVEIK